MVEIKWWVHLKSVIRSIAADYRLSAQSESRLEPAIKSGDSVKVAGARTKLDYSLTKKDQALVVTAQLKRIT